MTKYELADLFECFVSKIDANIRAVLKTGVLNETQVCQTYHYKNGNLSEQYNLEMIIALAFRINTRKSKIFREWIIKKAVVNTAEKSILMMSCSNRDFSLN